MRIIVTRPEPDASRTAEALLRLGHEAILSPMLDIITDRSARLPGHSFQALLVTSSNAIRAIAAHPDRKLLAPLPLFAVGDQTALEAKRAGFEKARSAGGALNDLAALVVSELSPSVGPMLYATGENRAGDLAGRLSARGFTVETAILYRAVPRERLSPAAEAALRDGSADGVLVYSPRSAEAFASALKRAGLAPLSEWVTCYCISPGAAHALPMRGRVRIATRPNQLGLFSMLEEDAARRDPIARS
jgi:uroporphyrinogen-III synthase